VVTVLSTSERDAESLDDYRGLLGRRPWLATLFAAMLFSLAGIPLTAGFVGKFYLTIAAGDAALWSLLVVMMVASGIGLFYYLRIIVAMFMAPVTQPANGTGTTPVSLISGATLAALLMLLIWLGLYPGPLIALIHSVVAGGE
jgi:NADH-quinone oxidoreductase subunit N